MKRVTRASNADVHPGMVQRGAPRRTSQQVQADREAKAAAKEKTAANKRANIQKVAEFEAKSRQKATAADLHGNNPPDKPTVAKGKRARTAESMVTEGMDVSLSE